MYSARKKKSPSPYLPSINFEKLPPQDRTQHLKTKPNALWCVSFFFLFHLCLFTLYTHTHIQTLLILGKTHVVSSYNQPDNLSGVSHANSSNGNVSRSLKVTSNLALSRNLSTICFYHYHYHYFVSIVCRYPRECPEFDLVVTKIHTHTHTHVCVCSHVKTKKKSALF